MDKVPARHKDIWWRNDDVSNSVSKRWKLCKEWKQGSTSKEKYLEAKNRIKKNCLPGKLLFNGTMKMGLRLLRGRSKLIKMFL